MKVNLIAYTPNPELVVASSAKLCYSASGVESLLDQTPEQVEKFLDKLMSIGHESPIEHVNFTFAVEGVSRVFSHQLVRHRIASYSQQSQRYVKLDQFEYITPPAIENSEYANFLFKKAMEEDQLSYDLIVEDLMDQQFQKFLNDFEVGEKSRFARFCVMETEHTSQFKKFEKKAIEDARFVFPNACETKVVFTMNARTLMNFFRHRCCSRAQWEIRAVANEMVKLVQEVAPTLFKYAGAPCANGKCPEGSMTCGKPQKINI